MATRRRVLGTRDPYGGRPPTEMSHETGVATWGAATRPRYGGGAVRGTAVKPPGGGVGVYARGWPRGVAKCNHAPSSRGDPPVPYSSRRRRSVTTSRGCRRCSPRHGAARVPCACGRRPMRGSRSRSCIVQNATEYICERVDGAVARRPGPATLLVPATSLRHTERPCVGARYPDSAMHAIKTPIYVCILYHAMKLTDARKASPQPNILLRGLVLLAPIHPIATPRIDPADIDGAGVRTH